MGECILLLLDGICVGYQAQDRDRWFTTVISVTRLSNFCQCLTSTEFGSTVAMSLSARVVAKSLATGRADPDFIAIQTFVCVISIYRFFFFFSFFFRFVKERKINMNVYLTNHILHFLYRKKKKNTQNSCNKEGIKGTRA